MGHTLLVLRLKRKLTVIKHAFFINARYKYIKCIFAAITALVLLLSSVTVVYSQSQLSAAEVEIRKLEEQQVEYLMNGKLAEMKKNWAADYTVNNPFNVVQDAATGPIQSGVLTYSKFERNIEKVLLHDSVIIVMGSELVIPKTAPKGSSHDTESADQKTFYQCVDAKGRQVADDCPPCQQYLFKLTLIIHKSLCCQQGGPSPRCVSPHTGTQKWCVGHAPRHRH